MIYEKGSFCQVINMQHIAGLDPMVQTTWMWLCKFAGKDGKCFPSLTKLMKMTGIKSRTTMIKKISELEQKGLIVKTKLSESENKHTRNNYNIIIVPSSDSVQLMDGNSVNSVQEMNVDSVQEVDNKYTNSKYTNIIINNKGNSSSGDNKEIGKDINKALTLWNSYNKEIGYANKNQRKAIEEMVKEIGIDKYLKMTELVISFQGKEFAPSITTPYEMKVKRIKINQYLDRVEA